MTADRPPSPTTGREWSLTLVVRIPGPVLRPEGHRHTRPDRELAALAVVDALRTAGILTVSIKSRAVPGWLEVPACLCPDHKEPHQ